MKELNAKYESLTEVKQNIASTLLLYKSTKEQAFVEKLKQLHAKKKDLERSIEDIVSNMATSQDLDPTFEE